MLRYLRVLSLFWWASIDAEMEYRTNFAVACVSSLLGLCVSIFGVYLFYRTGYRFSGWEWHEALGVLGSFTVLHGMSQSVLVPNMSRIVEAIEKGSLDFVLLKPISSQFWLSARAFSPWGIPDVLLGLGLIAYCGLKADASPWAFMSCLAMVLVGFVSLYGLWFVLATTSIWFVRVQNVTEVLRGFLEAGRYPITAYPAGYRFFFTFVVPIVFLTTVPVQALLGRAHYSWLGAALCLAAALVVVSTRFWRFALRFYTSASS